MPSVPPRQRRHRRRAGGAVAVSAFTEVFADAVDAILVVDARGLVVGANARATVLFGAHLSGVGRACLTLFTLDRGTPLAEPAGAWPELAARARRRALRLAATAHLADGNALPVELALWNAQHDGNALTVVLVRDVSDAMRQARRAEELARQLHQSQKLETIGRLAGGIAHDFNNLLTIISGYSELLAASPTTAPAMRESLAQVCQAAGRAAQLTGQLLSFSRQRSEMPVRIDVNRLVRREVEMLRRIVDEDIEFVTHLAPGLPDVRGDAGRFAQVVMNLVLNARDAMPSGGRLIVRTTAVAVRAGDPDHPGVGVPGTYVRMTVDDTGCGMTPEECEQVFEPFYTTKGAGLGTGLGMTTVRNIVEECGGAIAIRSTVGVGTSVQVYLPAAAPAPMAAAGTSGGRELPGGREIVLVVEDNAAVRALTETVLTDHGYTVLSAVDGDDAIRQLDRAPMDVQLVVSDVVMPHRNGRAVVAHAQRANPAIRALYLSGYTEDAIVRQGILRDDVRFLQKPFTPADLLRAVREALDA